MRHQLVSHFVAFAVIPAIAGGLLVVVGGAWLIQAGVFAHMQSIADGACSELQLVCSDAQSDLGVFVQRDHLREATAALASPATTPSARAASRSFALQELGQLLSPTERTGGSAIIVLMADLRPLIWLGTTAAGADEVVSRHIAEVRNATGGGRLLAPHLYAHTGYPVMGVAQAIPLPHGQTGPPVAALVWHIPLAYRVYPAIEERSHIGRTGEIVLVDRNGLALREVRYEPNSAFRKVIRTAPAARALSGQRGIVLRRDYRGVLVVAAVNRVPLTGWGIVAKEDAREAYEGVARLALIWALFVMALLGGAMVAARGLGARFLEPVEDLAAATHRLATGDLGTPVRERGEGELGALVADFNLMAAQIASAHEAVRRNEERLRLAMEAANEGLWDWDLVGNTSFRSPRFHRMLGYEPGELDPSGEAWQALIHPQDRERVGAAVAAALQHDASFEVEFRVLTRDRGYIWVLSRAQVVARNEAGLATRVLGTNVDITARREAEEALRRSNADRGAMVALLQMVSEVPDPHALARQVCLLLREWSGCEAVGIRWRLGDDYPYFETNGFPDDFVLLENSLCERDEDGAVVRDATGQPALECMCGNILRGRTDPELPFFSPGGSFWANNTTRLLATTTEADRQARTRNRCNGEGYESVALIPLRHADTTYGLLQLNDRQPNRFTAEGIALLERMADSVALGLARHEAATELQSSEHRYRSLFEGMIEGYACCQAITDDTGTMVDWVYLEVNPAFERITGLKEVAGKRVSEVIPGLLESNPHLYEVYGRVARTGSPEALQEYVPSLGTWFEVVAYCPEPGYFTAVFDDVTERKRAEEALRESEQRFRETVALLPVAVWESDLDANLTFTNRQFAIETGYSEEDVARGLNGLAMLAPEDRGKAEARVGGMLRGAPTEGLEYELVRKDGSTFPAALYTAVIGGPAHPTGLRGVIVDVSEHLRAEREFEERTALDRLVAITHRLLAETTPEGLLQQAAEGACALTGAVLGKAAHDFRGGDFRTLALAGPGGVPPSAEDPRLKATDHHRHLGLLERETTVRLTAQEFAGAAGGLLGASLVGLDGVPTGMVLLSGKGAGEFTAHDEALLRQLATFASLALARLEALRELELQARALTASNRELESFSYSVSHDLRAPLRAIDGFSQALLEDYHERLDETGRRYLTRVRNASQRLGELIDDLLQLSRVTRDPMRWEPVDLSALARDLIGDLREGDPGRQVEVAIAEGLTVEGHPLLLQALVNNLLANAWKFTRHQDVAHIVFGHEVQDDEVVYCVRDDGAGFDMKYADKLFVPFQRLHAQEDFPGNGVGLATVQRVINRHGGRIWAEGTENAGAAFYFTLGR